MNLVLHVVQCLTAGGAGRALVATAKYSARAGRFGHRVLSLLPPEPRVLELARSAGVEVVSLTAGARLGPFLAAADIVQVHFWNSPELYRFLVEPLPPVRLLVWCHVAGDRPPQIVTRELVAYADRALMCSPYHARLPVFREAGSTLVIAGPDFARLDGAQARPHSGFDVGYIGALDAVKMHPELVALSAAVRVPEARFIVCGEGSATAAMRGQAAAFGLAQRLELRGRVEDIGAVLATLDVFGYPLRPGNFAASELVLQEAMAAGVPPVVLDDGGAASMVTDGVTGLVVHDGDAYARAIERLHADPALRLLLARNAREYARAHYGAENAAPRMNAVYDELMALPRRPRPGLYASSARPSGSDLFVRALGGSAPAFAASLGDSAPFAADRAVGRSDAALMGELTGGVLHYRAAWPNDPMLRFWSGLLHQGQGRAVRALAEWQRAVELGLDPARVAPHRAQAIERIGAARRE